MNRSERVFVAIILMAISLLTVTDLITDSKEGVAWWHVLIEGLVAIVALIGVFILLKGTFNLKRSIESERKASAQLKIESDQWKSSSKRFLEGLSHSIDGQLSKWGLTRSEKEVAFLLIKGFSLKEIAEIRKTAEKTTRAQASSIYNKAGLSGRSQLSAFFLEDLLLPNLD